MRHTRENRLTYAQKVFRTSVFIILIGFLFGCSTTTAVTPIPTTIECTNPHGNNPELYDAPGDFLALSGGGYRAMLFHVGAIWRLNRAGYLKDLAGVSSVSGGSITAGVLAMNWERLQFGEDGQVSEDLFIEKIVTPVRQLATKSIEIQGVFSGLEDTYEQIYGKMTIAKLPKRPQFIFNAANMQTGARWWFTRDFVGDWSIGLYYRNQPGCDVPPREVSLAKAVAASSAYPPYFAPVTIELPLERCAWVDPKQLRREFKPFNRDCGISTDQTVLDSYRKRILLMDGGVVDNQGLGAIWQLCQRKTIDGKKQLDAMNHGDRWRCGEVFISDGGGVSGPTPSPPTDWFGMLVRTVGLMSDEPSALWTEIAIHQFDIRSHHPQKKPETISGPGYGRIPGSGAYWNIQGTELPADADEPLTGDEWCDVQALAAEPTHLKELDECKIRWLINWGFVAAERALPHIERFRLYSMRDKARPYPEDGFGPGSATSKLCKGKGGLIECKTRGEGFQREGFPRGEGFRRDWQRY
jgi:NTE family protein